jgi:hypothetical protein
VRASFLILLLGNILFLAWSLWVAAPASSDLAPAPPGDPSSMQLTKEAAPQAAVGAAAGPDRSSRAALATCVSFGPFADDASLTAASRRLEALGYAARRRTATDDVPAGQWVSVADLATPEDAANALNALRRSGLADAYVVTDSAPGSTTISVGLFTDPAGAADAADSVRRAGLQPRVTERMRTAEVTWLDIDRQANEGLPDIADVGGEQESPAIQVRACPPPG